MTALFDFFLAVNGGSPYHRQGRGKPIRHAPHSKPHGPLTAVPRRPGISTSWWAGREAFLRPMSVHQSSAAWKVRGISQTEKLVLVKLADNANDAGWC